jgi:hypothetical protein
MVCLYFGVGVVELNPVVGVLILALKHDIIFLSIGVLV